MIQLYSFKAKAIYGMMMERVSLSIKNGWLDEDGETYIHYSIADIMADTGCGKNKNTNINYINPILSIYTEDGMDEHQAYSEIVRESIDVESLMKRYPYEQKDVQEIYDLIVEAVMECLRKNATKVYNIKAYLLAALFSEGATMSNYYRAEVNHDMSQFAG